MLFSLLLLTLERIQKVALRIILGVEYISYENARNMFGLKTLKERRHDLCLKFALKLVESKHCEKFFNMSQATRPTRHQKFLVESFSNTKRCYNAPHNYLTRLVNENQ